MLKITGEGRKAALDMRLVQPGIEPPEDTKIDRAVSRIVKIWNDTRNERSTQLVFSDLSTPDPERFNVYSDIRSKLVAAGIPPREIAFIHDAETDTAKKVLFDGVNAGRVRILLGSTEKMGAGTNVQRRLVALHHLDAPWRPRDIEQREGRILRQGNDEQRGADLPLCDGGFLRRVHVADAGNQGALYPAGDARRNVGPGGRGPRQRRSHLRRDQGDCVRQSGRRREDQDRYRNPQARPVACRSCEPTAPHPMGDSRPAPPHRRDETATRRNRRPTSSSGTAATPRTSA